MQEKQINELNVLFEVSPSSSGSTKVPPGPSWTWDLCRRRTEAEIIVINQPEQTEETLPPQGNAHLQF